MCGDPRSRRSASHAAHHSACETRRGNCRPDGTGFPAEASTTYLTSGISTLSWENGAQA